VALRERFEHERRKSRRQDLRDTGFEVVPFDEQQVRLARRAWRRYGKGDHPAALNLGDCASYALSKVTGEPLLFKGDGFSQTGVVSVLAE